MRVLVIGRSGQLARALSEAGNDVGAEVVTLGRPDIDLASAAPIVSRIGNFAPDVIVNAAAYTNVDRAEDDEDVAYAINAGGASKVAAAASSLAVPIVQISTDYVFNGSGNAPYTETDAPDPLSAYGRTKLAGERLVAQYPNHAVLRTSWVYSATGTNFVRTMLRLASVRSEVRVVDDQYGCPTSARDLASGVLTVCNNLVTHPDDAVYRGLFHLVGAGDGAWADVAEATFEYSARCGGASARVVRIPSSDYPTRAVRPSNSRLDTTRIAEVHAASLRPWREALAECVEDIVAKRGHSV